MAAALIHSVYRNGDFRDGRKRICEGRRKVVRNAVGKEVEAYVYRFEGCRWNSKTIPVIRDTLHTANATERNVVLMRLANELEHHLDHEILYYYDLEGHRRFIDRHGHMMIDMAKALGFPMLIAELSRVFREAILIDIPADIREQASRDRSFPVIRTRQESTVIGPNSCRQRISVAVQEWYHRLCLPALLKKMVLRLQLPR